MKTALVTTTINVPKVLEWYRACDPDVRFFVAGDQKTPKEAYEFILSLENTQISLPESGHQWKCSELIGFGSIQRRNIAFLEALKWGAEIIVSVDDDNMPLDHNYFASHQYALEAPFDGVQVTGLTGWVDPGEYLRPKAKHRGFPTKVAPQHAHASIVNAKVGVSAGMCLLDPDIDAVTRIANAPDVQQVSVLAEAGFVANKNSWTVFNSQNTAILREFVPAWGMIPFLGRYDDIFASLIAQRVMRDRHHYVRFGRPYVFQDRNEHDLIKDLRGEIDGMDNIVRLATVLDHTLLPNRSVLDDCRCIWRTLSTCDWMPGKTVQAMFAYLDDIETVM